MWHQHQHSPKATVSTGSNFGFQPSYFSLSRCSFCLFLFAESAGSHFSLHKLFDDIFSLCLESNKIHSHTVYTTLFILIGSLVQISTPPPILRMHMHVGMGWGGVITSGSMVDEMRQQVICLRAAGLGVSPRSPG